ncbi:MAG: hypothetical protein GXP29_08310 [Planctomycetes bacterium]|nr:hypothetical protein [Planctomycetota bacterium]
MQRYAEYASQLFNVFKEHLPVEVMATQIPTGAVAMLLGVSICVLGAKLSRWFVAIVFASTGLILGMQISKSYDWPFPVTALVSSLVVGGVGYSLHRFLVGLFAGLFLSSVAFSLVSSQMVLPHLPEFEQVEQSQRTPANLEFQPGPAAGAIESGWASLSSYAVRFWTYMDKQQPNLRLHAVGWSVGAGLVGLLMGLFLNRLTLILFTAAFGTVLISGGMFVMAKGMGMDMLQATRARPSVSALAIGSFFIVSVLLQSALTRKTPAPAAE